MYPVHPSRAVVCAGRVGQGSTGVVYQGCSTRGGVPGEYYPEAFSLSETKTPTYGNLIRQKGQELLKAGIQDRILGSWPSACQKSSSAQARPRQAAERKSGDPGQPGVQMEPGMASRAPLKLRNTSTF